MLIQIAVISSLLPEEFFYGGGIAVSPVLERDGDLCGGMVSLCPPQSTGRVHVALLPYI